MKNSYKNDTLHLKSIFPSNMFCFFGISPLLHPLSNIGCPRLFLEIRKQRITDFFSPSFTIFITALLVLLFGKYIYVLCSFDDHVHLRLVPARRRQMSSLSSADIFALYETSSTSSIELFDRHLLSLQQTSYPPSKDIFPFSADIFVLLMAAGFCAGVLIPREGNAPVLNLCYVQSAVKILGT